MGKICQPLNIMEGIEVMNNLIEGTEVQQDLIAFQKSRKLGTEDPCYEGLVDKIFEETQT
jgi:hypothetical protein